MVKRIRIPGRRETVEPRLVEAFAEEGFGLLSRIPFDEVLREKRGVRMPPYVRLGFCHPELAERALEVAPELGTVLPCGVVLREVEDGVEVLVLDPQAAFQAAGVEGLPTLAEEVRRRVEAALGRLGVPT